MLLCFGNAIEGGCNEGAFEILFQGRRGRWVATCDGKVVDEFEYEEAWECTAEI